jgi:hypothetical protein
MYVHASRLLLYYRIYLASVCVRAMPCYDIILPKLPRRINPPPSQIQNPASHHSIPTPPNLTLIPHRVLLLHHRAPQLPLLFQPLLALRPARQPRRDGRQRRKRHIRRVRRGQTRRVRGAEGCGWEEPAGARPGFEVGCFCGCRGLGLRGGGLVVELAEGEGVCWGGG